METPFSLFALFPELVGDTVAADVPGLVLDIRVQPVTIMLIIRSVTPMIPR
jgi:hypothetical protein